MASIAKLRKEKRRFKAKNNLREVANTCNVLGIELEEAGEYEAALEEHEEEARIFEALQDPISVAIAHRRMGEVYCQLNNWDEALQHQRKHLSLAKEVENYVEQQRAYATLGRTHMLRAEQFTLEDDKKEFLSCLQESQNAFLKALSTCDKISNEVDVKELAQMRCRLYHNVGLVLDMKDDFYGALRFVSQGLDLCQTYDLTEDAYRAYSELGRIHLRVEKTSKALEEAQMALKLGSKLQNSRFIIDAHSLIAQIYLGNDDFLAARKALYKAFKIRHPSKEIRDIVEKNLKLVVTLCMCRDELSKPQTSVDNRLKYLDKIGDIFSNLGFFKQALVFYQKRLDLAVENKKGSSFLAPIYTSLAQTHKDNKEFAESLQFFQKELDIHFKNNPKESVLTLIEMAKVSEMMSSSATESSFEFFERALDVAKEANSFLLKIIVLKSYVASARIPLLRKEALEAELKELSEIHGSDVEIEESEAELESEDEVDLDTIEFSDSDEELPVTRQRVSRNCTGLKLKVNATGETLLHQAAIKGNVSMTKRLIEQNHPVNVRDHSGWLPIHEACNWGHVQVAELLIEAGAWINDRGGEECSGTTPLHDAANNGHVDIIQLLVEKGASVITKDNKGDTPLDCLVTFSDRNEEDSEEIEHCRVILVERMERAGYKVPEKLKKALRSKHKPSKDRNPRETSPCSSPDLPEDDYSFNIASIFDDLDEPNCADETRSQTSKNHSATETYKTAMKSVGSLSKNVESFRDLSTAPKDINRAPLIPEEEYVNEDWLIDDVDTATKKRKRLDCFEFEFREKTRRKSSSQETPVSSAREKKKTKQPKLTSFAKKGYVRQCNINDDDDLPNVISSSGYPDDSAQANLTGAHQSPEYSSHMSSNNSTKSPLRLHVKVLNKNLLVPVAASAQKHTIAWLKEEVARRYFKLAGVMLSLKLSTAKNEELNPEDSIDLVLSTDNSELEATVTGVRDLPSLPDRYAQACQRSNVSPLLDITGPLRNCGSSGELNLSQVFLRNEKDIHAILTSLQHENIQVLILNYCRLEDIGMAILIQSMFSLPLLQKLEVEGCSLSTKSLEALAQDLGEENSIKKLYHLNLSYNDFSDAKISHLKSLLRISSMMELKLSSCDMRLLDTPFGPTFPSTVQSLDLTENQISLGLISEIILSCTRLTSLSIHGCIGSGSITSLQSLNSPTLGESLSSVLGAGSYCALEHLDISHCQVTNQDLDVLTSYIYRCSSLETLNLSQNFLLSPNSVVTLIQEIDRSPDVPLKILNLHGIQSLANDETFKTSLEGVIRRRTSRAFPFVKLSLPFVELISLLWSELYKERAMRKIISKTMFLSINDTNHY